MPRITKVQKRVTEYTVVLTVQEMKCIMEVIGSTPFQDRKDFGCTEKEANSADAIYEVFVKQLRKDGNK